MSNLVSIEQFVQRIKNCHILVNNAGGIVQELHYAFEGKVEQTFLNNYLGTWYLTRLSLPVLAKTSLEDNCEVKIVTVGSSLEGRADFGKAFLSSSNKETLVRNAFLDMEDGNRMQIQNLQTCS